MLVNHLYPETIKNLTAHYAKFVDNFREWTVPKKLLPTPQPYVKPSKTPIHHFDSLIVTTGKTPTTSPPKVTPTVSSLFCPIDELEAKGLRVSRCKFTGQFNYLKPEGSSSNQGLIKGKVLHGAQCRIACTSYKKRPFSNSKMQCYCSSGLTAKFKIFSSLKELLTQSNQMRFTGNQCQWYDRTKKGGKPVKPLSVFPNSQEWYSFFFYLPKAQKGANFELSRLHYLQFQIPTALGSIQMLVKKHNDLGT